MFAKKQGVGAGNAKEKYKLYEILYSELTEL